MNDEVKIIYITHIHKSLSVNVLRAFVEKFPSIVEKFYQDRALLKNGITIIATNSDDCLIGKGHRGSYNVCGADCFLEYCYEKAYDIKQNNWDELMSWLISEQEGNLNEFQKRVLHYVFLKMQEIENGEK